MSTENKDSNTYNNTINLNELDYETEAAMKQAYGSSWREINPSVFESKPSPDKKTQQVIRQTQSEEEYEDRMCMGLVMNEHK